jgi:hypothetical protein
MRITTVSGQRESLKKMAAILSGAPTPEAVCREVVDSGFEDRFPQVAKQAEQALLQGPQGAEACLSVCRWIDDNYEGSPDGGWQGFGDLATLAAWALGKPPDPDIQAWMRKQEVSRRPGPRLD